MHRKFKKHIRPVILATFATWLLLGIDARADFKLSDTQGSSISKDTVLIRLAQDLQFHWSNSLFDIIDDSLYLANVSVYVQNRKLAIRQITNPTKTFAETCNSKVPLTLGDMAVVLINRIDHLPPHSVFKKQFCLIYPDCRPFRKIILDYVNDNRTLASLQIGNYLESISSLSADFDR